MVVACGLAKALSAIAKPQAADILSRLRPLARQLVDALAAFRQQRLLDDQDREAVLDLEAQGAALAKQVVPLGNELRPARVERTTQDIEKLLTDHRPTVLAISAGSAPASARRPGRRRSGTPRGSCR